tara:strand:+ start:265 stop:792 length:528 start_codon:yes stop_codon:yes gene_type:complete
MTKELEIIFGVVVCFEDESKSKAIESILKIDPKELDHKRLYVISSMSRSIDSQYAVNTSIELESKGIITRSIMHMYPDNQPLVEYEAFGKLSGATHLLRINQQDVLTQEFLKTCEREIKENHITCLQNNDETLTVVPWSIVNKMYNLIGSYDGTVEEIKKLSKSKGFYFKNGEKK